MQIADKILKISPQSPPLPPSAFVASFWSVLAGNALVYIYSRQDHMASGH